MRQDLPNLIHQCDVNVAWLYTAEFWSLLNASSGYSFSGLSNSHGKGNVAHVQTAFHVRIMVRICFILAFASPNTFLFMKMLDFSEND